MDKYIEMLNKIFISTNGLTISDSVIYYRIAESVGFIAFFFFFFFGVLMIFEQYGELSQLVTKLGTKFYNVLASIFILGGLSLVFIGVRNPSNYGENYTLTREGKIALSDYVSNLSKEEQENLTNHVKLYGDVFESDSESLKLINKYLMDTIGK